MLRRGEGGPSCVIEGRSSLCRKGPSISASGYLLLGHWRRFSWASRFNWIFSEGRCKDFRGGVFVGLVGCVEWVSYNPTVFLLLFCCSSKLFSNNCPHSLCSCRITVPSEQVIVSLPLGRGLDLGHCFLPRETNFNCIVGGKNNEK